MRIASGIESQIATLTAYRKSLIHECVTGQRRVTEADLSNWNAQWGSPPIYVSLVEWADHIISE